MHGIVKSAKAQPHPVSMTVHITVSLRGILASILFLLSPEVSGMSGTMSIYIIYVNNLADANSVRNLSAIFR